MEDLSDRQDFFLLELPRHDLQSNRRSVVDLRIICIASQNTLALSKKDSVAPVEVLTSLPVLAVEATDRLI